MLCSGSRDSLGPRDGWVGTWNSTLTTFRNVTLRSKPAGRSWRKALCSRCGNTQKHRKWSQDSNTQKGNRGAPAHNLTRPASLTEPGARLQPPWANDGLSFTILGWWPWGFGGAGETEVEDVLRSESPGPVNVTLLGSKVLADRLSKMRSQWVSVG